MKTFDIAEKYLEDLNYSVINIYIDPEKQLKEAMAFGLQLAERQKKFLADENNTISNDHYRSMVFAACFYHCADLFYRKVSYWDVSCEIIEFDIHILGSKYEGWTPGSLYPKIMIDKFITYCDQVSPQPLFLNEKSETRIELFMAAFHYITEHES